jgi:hypothetical protein
VTLILLLAVPPFLAAIPWVIREISAHDDSLDNARLAHVMAALLATGTAYWATGWLPLFALYVAVLTLTLWLGWQALLAIWGRGVVYLLRLHPRTGPRAGWVAYTGHTGREDQRMAEHRDDRNPGWAPWKADIDWRISGPAWRRLTVKGAHRLEDRTIRATSYAAQIGICPPIENDLTAKLHGPAHPLLAIRLVWLRFQGLILPNRALHQSRPEAPDDNPGSPTEDDVDLPAYDPDADPAGPIIDVDCVAEAASTSRDRSASRPDPRTHGPASSASPAPPADPPTSTSLDLPSHPVVSPDPFVSSDPAASSHPDPVPPEGGNAPHETTAPDETIWDDETTTGETIDQDELEAEGEAEGPGTRRQPSRRVRTKGRRASRSGKARGKTDGGAAPAPSPFPAWVPDARRLRREHGMSYQQIVDQLRADGIGTPSKATVGRWLADLAVDSDG